MNFVDLEGLTDAADSSTLEETTINTGLSIRGAMIWLVHKVEIIWPRFTVDEADLTACLCTVGGLAAMPSMADRGVIWKSQRTLEAGAAGRSYEPLKESEGYLPPIPLAAPSISIYLATATDQTELRAKMIQIRVGFTTAPLDAQAYTEIAETWGW